MGSVSNVRVSHQARGRLGLAVAILGAACGRPQGAAETAITTRTPPACQIYAPSACRVGCDADVPKQVAHVAPELAGIDLTGLRGVEIAEILIDERGDVKDICLLRGVREDIDARAVAAIRQWRYEPARLRHSTPTGAVVPLVMTVTVPIGQ